MTRLPTVKQAKALKLIREGVPLVKAMREAGYSKLTSEAPSQNLLRGAAAQEIIETFREVYASQGITPHYLVLKNKEWLAAQKRDQYTGEETPDYQIQLQAAKLIRQDMGLDRDMATTVNNTQNNLILSDEQLKRIIEG